MARHRLTDQQWGMIEDVFPAPAATGRPPVDPRDMMDAILWRLRTGSPWRDLPKNRDARPVDFGKERDRRRNIVERLIGWLKECRWSPPASKRRPSTSAA